MEKYWDSKEGEKWRECGGGTQKLLEWTVIPPSRRPSPVKGVGGPDKRKGAEPEHEETKGGGQG